MLVSAFPWRVTIYLTTAHSQKQKNSPKEFGTLLLSLLPVYVFHQDSLVFEHITLGLHVQIMVHVVVNLFCLSVFSKQPSEHSHTSHPDGLFRHTCIRCTFSFTIAAMPTLLSGFICLSNTSTAVDDLWLFDDQTIFDELTDILTCK